MSLKNQKPMNDHSIAYINSSFLEPPMDSLKDLQFNQIPKTPEQYKLGPIKNMKKGIRGTTPDNYVPKMSNYSKKRPLNKKYIEQLLERDKVPRGHPY